MPTAAISRRCRPSCRSFSAGLPKAPFEVAAVPDYLEKTAAPAYYEAGTPDGSRPGRLFVDTYNATDRNLYSVESIAYHEGIPGHHLQISIAQELTGRAGVPQIRRYTAYTEGWALYSEQLGKDVGFYQDPYSDYGRLEARHLARHPPRRRHRRPLPGLDPRADGRILPRPLQH